MAFFSVLGFVVALLATPFPVPRTLQDSPALKSDLATVEAVDMATGQLKGLTAAGPVVYKVTPTVQVFDKDGKQLGSPATLLAGQKIRLYYLIDQGAVVLEIGLD